MQINSVTASPVWKYSSNEKGKTSQTAQNQKYLIFDSTPEEVVSKYNINQISEEEYSQMTRELWLNKNEESKQLGRALIGNQLMDDPTTNFSATDGQNMLCFAKDGSGANVLDAVLEKYKQQLSLNSDSASTYLKLYQTLWDLSEK
ncbi:hypothetical protein ACRQV7_11430 [Caproiciproducens sp. R2]|uniref:hypothetical protein n=1 Tax=Caproiciproducens sp. R2 TaxID=3435187 RepID=UPI0040337734